MYPDFLKCTDNFLKAKVPIPERYKNSKDYSKAHILKYCIIWAIIFCTKILATLSLAFHSDRKNPFISSTRKKHLNVGPRDSY